MNIYKRTLFFLAIPAFMLVQQQSAAAEYNGGSYCAEYSIYGTKNSPSGCPDPGVTACAETVFGPSGNDPTKVAVTVSNKYNSEYEAYLEDGFFSQTGDVLNYISDKFSGSTSPRIPDLVQYRRLLDRQAACPRRIGRDRKILNYPANLRLQNAAAPLAASSGVSSIAQKILDAVNNIGAIIQSYIGTDRTLFAKFGDANARALKKYGPAYPAGVITTLDSQFGKILAARETRILRSRMRISSLLASLNIFDGATVAADFDNNGVKDYALLDPSGAPLLQIVMIRKINGSNLPVTTAQYEFSFMPRVTPARLDGDTLIDLLVDDPKGIWPSVTMLNNGDGTFRILRPEGWPRLAMRAASSTACFTRVSSGSTFCKEIGLNAAAGGEAPFGYVRSISDPLYSEQFVGTKFAKNDEFKVKIQGRYQPGVSTDRMGVQAFFQDQSGQTYTESCSQSQSNYALVCSYQTTDQGVHWNGRCACTIL